MVEGRRSSQRYLSGRSKIIGFSGLSTDRHLYVEPGQVEPNLGFPGEKSLPVSSTYYKLITVDNGTTFDRYWQEDTPATLVNGISIFDEGTLVGTANTVSKLDFVGAAVSATASGTISTITVTPVSISTLAPPNARSGDLWWDSDEGELNVYYQDINSAQWVLANSGIGTTTGSGGGGGGGGGANVTVSSNPPTSPTPSNGDLWWDSDVGELYIYYADGDSNQWVETSGGSETVTISDNAPSSPNAGDLWWESDTGSLKIYYNDGDSSQWVDSNAGVLSALSSFNFFTQNSAGIHTLGNVGIGTTNVTAVDANNTAVLAAGIVTAFKYFGDGSNLTGVSGGAQGAVGAQGSQGATGSAGSTGAQGTTGSTGAQGATGSTGAQGANGNTGAQGAQGVAGTAASQGAQGAQGATGSAGSTGAQGAQGVAGTAASQGAQGATGATGAQGAQGHQGATGSGGSTGAQGATGATGAQGANGNTGAQGAQGHQGATGSGGSTGAQGAQGHQGVSGSRVFTVTNSSASAYVIDGSNNPTLNLLRGFTYTFNINASGHPFFIKTSSSIGTGNQYTSGVTGNGTQSGTLTFAVPYNAPNTLYYNCQYHLAMAGTINISDVGPTGAQGAQGHQGATGSSYSSSDDITTRNLKVTGITTFTGPTVKFTGDSYNAVWNQSDDELEFKDNARLGFGDNGSGVPSDLTISHNTLATPPASQITNRSDSQLEVIADMLELRSGTSDRSYLTANVGAATTIFHSHTKRFETTTDGVKITGGLQDKDGQLGTSGQVLSSTGTELNWVAATSGAQGAQGHQGATGSGGSTGAQGAQGHQGATGGGGSTGAQGAQGHQGAGGSGGSTGAQGAQGHQGQSGSGGGTGAQGSAGAQGASGSGGGTGAQGSAGAQGASGSGGSTGAQGAQGHQGATGSGGSTGAQGAAGAGLTPAIESSMRGNDVQTNSESYQDAISVTINPTVSGSKLLVVGAGIMMHYWYEDYDDPEGNQCEAHLYRGSTQIGYSAVSSGPVKRQFGSGFLATGFNLTVRDSYAHNGNSVTYKLKFRRYGTNGNGFVKIQKGTSLTVQEII